MEKEFVPYQLSLAMKELGYNEQCFGFWSSENTYRRSINDSLCNSDLVNMFGDEAKQTPSAPTWQQAFRWFMEKYDLDYSLPPESSSRFRLLDRTFNIVIYKYYMNMNVQSEIVRIDGEIARYNKREEAEIACLKKLIEIVKQKKLFNS